MARDWHEITAEVDAIVDDTFGESIELVPWAKQPYTPGAPDPDRHPRTTVGVYRAPAVVVGVISGTSVTQPDIRVQIRSTNVGDIRQYDRVRLLDPVRGGAEFEIAWIDPGNVRHTLHLIPVRETDL